MGGADQRPLCLHCLKPRSRNCRNPRTCLICPNTGSRILLSQSVPAAITGALQLLPHFLRHLAADLARGLGRMLGSPGSDIGVDFPGLTLPHIPPIDSDLPRSFQRGRRGVAPECTLRVRNRAFVRGWPEKARKSSIISLGDCFGLCVPSGYTRRVLRKTHTPPKNSRTPRPSRGRRNCLAAPIPIPRNSRCRRADGAVGGEAHPHGSKKGMVNRRENKLLTMRRVLHPALPSLFS